MKIYLFDMDGVLLKANGYHRALQETVRLAGLSLGVADVFLSLEQIAEFEALGISSEFQSSALCMAVMHLNQQNHGLQSGEMKLEELFEVLAGQPMRLPAVQRAYTAVEVLAARSDVPSDQALTLIRENENIEVSQTMNWFQELVLGSEFFAQTFQKPPQFETESYLDLYDVRLLSAEHAERLMALGEDSQQWAAIMTNRPSNTLLGRAGTPEAELGARLVGLAGMPSIGYGEICWLAGETGREPGELNKPAWQHAMAAALAASGWTVEDSMRQVGKLLGDWDRAALEAFQGSSMTVFEDTPGGVIAVEQAAGLLGELGIQMQVRKIGIAQDEPKRRGLTALGAQVYPSINDALAALDDF